MATYHFIATGNLAFPLLLVGGLFLLSRRGGGAGGPGGFGGGNNPMQMGKSKAKFQMEPNTGITFDDVAGVKEAKEDFEEVKSLATPPPVRAGASEIHAGLVGWVLVLAEGLSLMPSVV